MITYGYDWFSPDGPIPNGNPRCYHIDPHLYQPPNPAFTASWISSIYPIEAASVSNLVQANRKFIYPLATLGYPVDWFGSYLDHPHFLSNVSVPALEAIRKGQAILFIDTLHEGFSPLQYDMLERLQVELERNDIPGANTIWGHSNTVMDRYYREWASRFPGRNVFKLFTAHGFLDIFSHHARCLPNEFVQKVDENNYRRKHYICLNRLPHPHRQVLVAKLLEADLTKWGLVSMPSPSQIPYRDYFDDRWQTIRANLAQSIENLKQKTPLIVDQPNPTINHVATNTTEMYQNTYLSVVSETHYMSPRQELMFLSEKTCKAILNFHPFILVGLPGSLTALREMGFELFHPFINEDYDQQTDNGIRMMAIIEEIRRFCERDLGEIHDWYRSILPKLRHNRDLLLNSPLRTKSLFDRFAEFCQS